MQAEQAAEIVSYLNAAYPVATIERETFEVYVADIALLADVKVATEAARRIVKNSDRFPTIHEFRQTYRSVIEWTPSEQTAIEPPKREKGIPAWVYVWAWMRENGDERTLPQQSEYGNPYTILSDAEYAQMFESWQAAGEPHVGFVAAVKQV